MNKLYILRPVGYTGSDWEDGVWSPWYDKTFGFVVSASSPTVARQMAASTVETGKYSIALHDAWLDPQQSSCKELRAGVEEIIIEDFRSA